MKIGLIAGAGEFPFLFAEEAGKQGYEIYAAAYVNEADRALSDKVHCLEWFHLGQVSRLLKYFKKNGVREAVMLGSVEKTRIFTDIKPDFRALSFIARMGRTHDDRILKSFADLLENEGVRIRPSTFLLPEIVNRKGIWTKRKPSKAETGDIKVGWPIAKEIGRFDIGQCVVVGNGSVLAVEAVDGTDATIRRGAGLSRGNAVVIKVAKPDQDLRFDMPCSGCGTIETMHRFGATALALEAEKTISFDRERMIATADQYGIAIVST